MTRIPDVNDLFAPNVNPAPADLRCDGCGTHVDKLPEYGGPGHLLVGDFTGAVLVKKYRDYAYGFDEGLCAGSSWECRECCLLDEEEYWTNRENRIE